MEDTERGIVGDPPDHVQSHGPGQDRRGMGETKALALAEVLNFHSAPDLGRGEFSPWSV
jgi:hypothetical protein